VCALLLASPEWREAVSLASFPAALRVYPEGIGWAAGVVPITPGIARVAQVVFLTGTSLGLLGAYARPALTASLLASLYLFALPQLTGSVLHGMHLLWFLALLGGGGGGGGGGRTAGSPGSGSTPRRSCAAPLRWPWSPSRSRSCRWR
jgi:hypothetical protein